MIDLRILLSSLKFVFLPTLGLFLSLIFILFSVDGAIAFISGNSSMAITLRVFILICEILLVAYVYKELRSKEAYNNVINAKAPFELLEIPEQVTGTKVSSSTSIGNLFSTYVRSEDKIIVHSTSSSKILVLQLTKDKDA